MRHVKHLLVAYAIAVASVSALTALSGVPGWLAFGGVAVALELSGLIFLIIAAVVTALLLPVTPVIVWAAARGWHDKLAAVAATNAYFVLVWLAWDGLIGTEKKIVWAGISEHMVGSVVLAGIATVVVLIFFVIEAAMRRRHPGAANKGD
jgi:hypothetical protein